MSCNDNSCVSHVSDLLFNWHSPRIKDVGVWEMFLDCCDNSSPIGELPI